MRDAALIGRLLPRFRPVQFKLSSVRVNMIAMVKKIASYQVGVVPAAVSRHSPRLYVLTVVMTRGRVSISGFNITAICNGL